MNKRYLLLLFHINLFGTRQTTQEIVDNTKSDYSIIDRLKHKGFITHPQNTNPEQQHPLNINYLKLTRKGEVFLDTLISVAQLTD